MEKLFEELIKEFQERELPDLTERSLKLPYQLNKVFVVYGLRRAGKTFYLYQIIKELLKKGYQKKEIFYLDFEDERLEEIQVKDLAKIIELYFKFNPKRKNPIFFFDEIQEVKGWEKFIRRISEKLGAKVFLTGSSSRLLSKEIATALRGRALSYQLFPFSFEEFLKNKNFKIDFPLTERKKGQIKNLLEEYLFFGGFPEIVNFPEKEKLKTLKEYLDLIVYRDLVERFEIKNLSLLKLLIRALIESFAKEFSLRKYYNFLKSQGKKVSKNTLYFYFSAIEEINFFFPLRKYSKKLREIEGSLPKIYLTDLGFLNLYGKKDFGKRMENLVAIEFLRKKEYQNILIDIFYYKDESGKEVDFLLKEKGKIKQLIQTCYNIEDFETREREIKGLILASKELNCNDLLIITWDFEAKEKIKGKKIKFLPLWKWLLQ
jgi:predicted AAA+ superfamily ATPase